MTTRIVIPVENQTGLESPIAQHFGRAPFFAVVDIDDNHNILGITAEMNRGEHMGGSGHAHEHLLALKPNVFVTYGMGLGCLSNLQSFGVTVLKATGSTVKETLEQFKEGKLEPLTGGCAHSHHHGNC